MLHANQYYERTRLSLTIFRKSMTAQTVIINYNTRYATHAGTCVLCLFQPFRPVVCDLLAFQSESSFFHRLFNCRNSSFIEAHQPDRQGAPTKLNIFVEDTTKQVTISTEPPCIRHPAYLTRSVFDEKSRILRCNNYEN